MNTAKENLIGEIGGGQRQEIEAMPDQLANVIWGEILTLKEEIESLEKQMDWEEKQHREKKLFMAAIICSRPEMTPEQAVLMVNKLEEMV